MLFDDERATKAALSFLRKTKVGEVITTPPRDGKEEEGGEDRRETPKTKGKRWKGRRETLRTEGKRRKRRRGGQGPP